MVGHPVGRGPNFQKQGFFVHLFPTALTTIRNLKRLLSRVSILHIWESILKAQRPEKITKGSWTKRCGRHYGLAVVFVNNARVSHSRMFHTS